jgi:RNA-directed DNA polymerase
MLRNGWIGRRIAKALSAELLAGAWNKQALLVRTARLLGASASKSQGKLVADVLKATTTAYPPSPEDLIQILLQSKHFGAATTLAAKTWRSLPTIPRRPRFAPAARFAGLDIPKLTTEGDLAAWLELSVEHLEWFADARRQQGRTVIPDLQHYAYHFVPKRNGPPRLIEAPKPRLKAMQRRILNEILDKVPQHECAFGFVAGRSCLDGAQRHAGEALVLTADLTDFFPSTPMGRVHAIFRSLGFPWAVARVLTNLCSTQTPASVFLRLPKEQRPDWSTQRMFQSPHLSQGAPTSPALANLAAFGLDNRLHGLAAAFGGRYTRYADDLACSGDEAFAARAKGLIEAIRSIASGEGYRLNEAKFRRMPQGTRQIVTGLVVNDHINVPRAAFDALKATLHNCARQGPASQNQTGAADFRAHLNGRVGWVEQVNPARGRKLRAMFDQISWRP